MGAQVSHLPSVLHFKHGLSQLDKILYVVLIILYVIPESSFDETQCPFKL